MLRLSLLLMVCGIALGQSGGKNKGKGKAAPPPPRVSPPKGGDDNAPPLPGVKKLAQGLKRKKPKAPPKKAVGLGEPPLPGQAGSKGRPVRKELAAVASSFQTPLLREAFEPKFKAVQTKLLDALELNAKDPKGARGLHIPGWLHLYRALNDCRTILVNIFRFLSGSRESPDVAVQTLAEIAQNKRLHPVARALLDSFRVVPDLLTIVKDHEKMLAMSPDTKDLPLREGYVLSQGKQGVILKGSLTGVTHINFGFKGSEDPRALTMALTMFEYILLGQTRRGVWNYGDGSKPKTLSAGPSVTPLGARSVKALFKGSPVCRRLLLGLLRLCSFLDKDRIVAVNAMIALAFQDQEFLRTYGAQKPVVKQLPFFSKD